MLETARGLKDGPSAAAGGGKTETLHSGLLGCVLCSFQDIADDHDSVGAGGRIARNVPRAVLRL